MPLWKGWFRKDRAPKKSETIMKEAVSRKGNQHFDDKPIEKPEDDKFGFDTFSSAIATSIAGNKQPEGTVVAIHGPWGTGKSSIVNLIKHHLATEPEAKDIEVLNFNCWWFKGEEALALEFFRQLYGVMEQTDVEKAKDAVSKLGSRILSGSSSFVGAAINLAAPGIGGAASSGMNLLADLIKQDKTVESFHAEVSEALNQCDKRYLIVIDDIDRLSPEEALLVFRLVKSVGRLPKVMYLLAYDRDIADSIVSQRYPSEGPQYLEKIVQAGFDIPLPPQSSLMNILLEFLNDLWKDEETPETRHFWNFFHDAVSPQIKSPRDLIRVTNTLRISWQAVAGEVDPVDFLVLETLRVQQPRVYAALKANKHRLTNGGLDHQYRQHDAVAATYEELFVPEFSGEEREAMKQALRRLFPALDRVWGNMSYDSSVYQDWERERRACSRKHFDTYFRFSLSDETISAAEVRSVIQNSSDADFVSTSLLEASRTPKPNGHGTRASVLLDELNAHAKSIPIENAVPFLAGLFSIHDQIDTEKDQERGGFAIANNNLRTHWTLRALLWGRTSLAERSDIIVKASEKAGVGWLVDLSESAYRDYHPREGKPPEPEDRCLTTEDDADKLREMALEKITKAAGDGTLLQYEHFLRVLYRWDDLAGKDGHELAKAWCMERLGEDDAVEAFSKSFVSESWVTGMGGFGGSLGDTVSVRRDRVSVESLERFFDTTALRTRVEALLAASEDGSARHAALKRFIDAWDAGDED
ncbi:P-loop NTPase fold protein [uncultured Paracoccus sp.]|uniref:KAP family P-loop NTPase fold protein n=1 Tax=uncultured Paracoccus sp. TaxID=189685 RepID=UPI0026171499|nr:P-loop NTPase fold protein [uncultured Paracoccus sp.]